MSENQLRLLLVAVGGLVAWRLVANGAKVVDAVTEVVTEDINPASDQNVIYRGANSLFWPDGSNTLGTWLYNITHPGE